MTRIENLSPEEDGLVPEGHLKPTSPPVGRAFHNSENQSLCLSESKPECPCHHPRLWDSPAHSFLKAFGPEGVGLKKKQDISSGFGRAGIHL